MADGVDELRAVRAAWGAATRNGGAACGLPVAAEAFERMREAWLAEFDAHLAVLERLRPTSTAAGATVSTGVAGAASTEEAGDGR